MSNEVPKRCWSWEHQFTSPVDPIAGRRVCAAHLSEEPFIAGTLAELTHVSVAVERFEALPDGVRNGDAAKAMVEDAVKHFLMRGSEEHYRAGTGLLLVAARSLLEFDVVVDPGDATGWYGSGRVLEEGEPVFGHLEVAFRTSRDLKKLRADFERLNASIDRGLSWSGGPRKTWTSAVICGRGWQHTELDVGRMLHEVTHGRAGARIGTDQGDWWPAIDLVVGPGFFWKKTEIVTDRATRLAWMLYRVPNTGDDERNARPLAVARGFLRNFLAMRRSGRLETRTPAWTGPPSAERGPCAFLADYPTGQAGARIVAAAATDAEPRCGWWDTGGRRSLLQLASVEDGACENGAPVFWAVANAP